MNYGYNEATDEWNETLKKTLALELAKKLKLVIGWAEAKAGQPYIEVDGGYGGVRIRRITHLTDEKHDKLVKDADKVYDEVMRNIKRE